jgi:hypothetical protein
MSKKLIYLTSVIVLSLAGSGWSKALNPAPANGAVYETTWMTLSWRAGEDAVSFDIYVGTNYDDVKNGTGGTFQGNQSRNETFFILGFPGYPYPNGLEPGTTYYWRVDEIINQRAGNISVGDVWSFRITPRTAYNPEPADGAELVETNVVLSWEPGFHAVLHFVYFGDSYNEVNDATNGHPRGDTTYNPGILELGKTYYWRVDESDGRDTYKGDVWSFTVGTEGPPPGGEEGVFYVDAVNGNDHNNGSTPRTAFATIKRGIDTAEDGQVVLVYPGQYLEEINFIGKAITVQGVAVSPAGVPVLWNPGDFAVSFYSGEGPDSILKNFIIKDSFMGVFIADGSPTLSNLTIVGNKYGIEAYAGSAPDISNTILWNNTDGDLFGCRARYSCIERGSEGEGNITDEPLFVDTDNGDYHLRSERGRYWPRFDIWVLDKATSSCIDAGDPAADISNEPMPNGGRINIGAYGGTSEASLSPNEQPYPLSKKASNPNPPDEAVNVDRNVTLSWSPGFDAALHNVYLGIDLDQVSPSNNDSALVGKQTSTIYDPGILDYNQTYYWRIDEIDSEGNRTIGDIWTFTTARPPKGRACFTAETNVWVNDVLVQISKAAAGQSIHVANSHGKIQEIQEHNGIFACYDILLESGNCISVAENHYFLSESGQWISLKNLKAGIKLKTSKYSIGIKSITKRPMPYVGNVYNLNIAGSDRYLVGKDAVIVRDF